MKALMGSVWHGLRWIARLADRGIGWIWGLSLRYLVRGRPQWDDAKARYRVLCAERRGFDIRLLRWAATICSCLAAMAVFWFSVETELGGLNFPLGLGRGSWPAIARWAAAAMCVCLGTLLVTYFGHLLLRRMRFTLLEWLVAILLLGGGEGLILSTPGLFEAPWTAIALAGCPVAWVAWGMAGGLAEIELLGIRHTLARIGILALNWLRVLYLPLLAVAVFLIYFRIVAWPLVAPRMIWWAVGIIVLLVVSGMAMFGVSRLARREARRILGLEVR
jgi:hypothetical protein